MLEQIGSYDAKTRLPEILRRVALGESFTITNRGKPIADIIPSHTDNQLKVQASINNIMAAKKHPVTDKTLAELRTAGRR
jgi:prevent-host-death family protein